jgi:hypothetical protein
MELLDLASADLFRDLCSSHVWLWCRAVAGMEYELLLIKKLREAGISYFWTENDLRAQGYYKTPDIRLQVGCHSVPARCISILSSVY